MEIDRYTCRSGSLALWQQWYCTTGLFLHRRLQSNCSNINCFNAPAPPNPVMHVSAGHGRHMCITTTGQCYTEKAPNAWHRRGTQKTGYSYNQQQDSVSTVLRKLPSDATDSCCTGPPLVIIYYRNDQVSIAKTLYLPKHMRMYL